ncbi:glycoside hydrolase family 15 protein [Methanoculleus sp. FWC-SCC1]|uniref:Glycoside hydrolase family 15 protein n=1 Tax=Methanoculleus frigidifontis TaxID=2584085 RepID=A0ABT8M8V0_9EURY|nr:glycoside hydrolase family 15 protein [Methanoculleus sp. FWC-SCC1]MDN7024367.1 glycoside hydrolase family 15 protein [Methanoculleus sp. FWC-SCC1]
MIRPLTLTPYPDLSQIGIVGDGQTAALVTDEGVVEWWCPERFDAPAVFARLIDAPNGGYFATGLPVHHKIASYYEEGTNILVSDLGTADATVRVTTFMPYPRNGAPLLIRLVSSSGLPIDVTATFAPAFRYGEVLPTLEQDGEGIVARGDGETLRLFATAPMELGDGRADATNRFRDGDVHAFVLAYGDGAKCPDPRGYAERLLTATRAYWREWSGRCTYAGEHRGDVLRSLLSLKLIQYQPAGTFVAAPTLGLPEQPGGERNWDYRYVWLRDGVFVVMAFESTGYTEEADAFRRWLATLLRRDPPERLQPLYTVDHGREVAERDLDHAEGYRHSRPVHVGNGAGNQFQLDTYGEVMLCFHRAPHLMRGFEGPAIWEALRRLVDWVCANWRRPDAGIWEIRGENYQQVFSKAMAYMAVRRGIEIAAENGFPAPLERWEQARDEIWEYVNTEGYSEEIGAYTQMTERIDADVAMLLFPIVGVTDYDHERFAGTVRYIEETLDEEGYLQRYIIDDNLPGREGAFLPACFWMATVKANQGDLGSARDWYARAYRAASPLGLFSEEIDGVGRVMLGNFPQALTHLSHVLAAWAIDHAGEEKRGRAEPVAVAAR